MPPRSARRRRARTAVLLLLAAGALACWLAPAETVGPTGAWMAELGLAPRTEVVDGLRVRYLRAGSGPPLVLLHGFASSIFTWRDTLPALARGHDVVALDLPGFGGSEQPVGLTAERYPRVVIGLMDRLGIERFALMGNSLGGAVALLVAADHPARVERLVLVDAAGLSPAPRDRPWVFRLGTSRPAAALIERLPVRRLLVRIALRQIFFDDARVTRQREDEYLAPLLRPGAMASIQSLLAAPPIPLETFEAAARRVRAPTLVLWGAEDRWIPPAHAQRFARAIPGAQVRILEGCGHMPQEECADALLAASHAGADAPRR